MPPHPTLTLGEIIANREVVPGHFQMDLRLAPTFADPVPGQFVMIRSAGHREPLLARPLSIYGCERRGGETVLSLLYRIVGKGTSLLAGLESGAPVSLLGPLGTGFTVPVGMKQAFLVAGGVGVAPLAFLLDRLCRLDGVGGNFTTHFFLGAKSAPLLAGLERLGQAGKLTLCTDDGSQGRKGLVTEALRDAMSGCNPADAGLFVCGPHPMVRALADQLCGLPFFCQVSLEERMACGLGACLGCAVAVYGEDGGRTYQRVCKDGPVFDLKRVVMEQGSTAQEGR